MTRRNITLLLNLIFLIISIVFVNRDGLTVDIDRVDSPKQPSTNSEVLSESSDYFEVVRVIDGDTIELRGGEKVRYIGIDSPESSSGGDCFFEEAKKNNEELVLGKTVRLEKDVSERDRYGRLLRYVYVGDVFINRIMVETGYAKVSTYPPDVKYKNIFIEAERSARENKLGLWSKCVLNQE